MENADVSPPHSPDTEDKASDDNLQDRDGKFFYVRFGVPRGRQSPRWIGEATASIPPANKWSPSMVLPPQSLTWIGGFIAMWTYLFYLRLFLGMDVDGPIPGTSNSMCICGCCSAID